MMNYFEDNWYTDLMTIKRHTDVTVDGLDKSIEETKATDIPCHIYSTSKSSLTTSGTSATIQEDNKMACGLDVDIKTGDVIYVTRFATGEVERYLVGKPASYKSQFGGVDVGLDHKEFTISLKEHA